MCETVLDHDNWEKARTTYIIAKIIADDKERILMLKNENGTHAEEFLIRKLNELKVFDVTLFMNNSPCSKCAKEFIKYLDANEDVEMTLFVTCLYMVKRKSCEEHSKCIKNKTENNDWLKNLKAHDRCKISGYTIKVWKDLLKLMDMSIEFRKQFWKKYRNKQDSTRSRKNEDKYIRSDLSKI